MKKITVIILAISLLMLIGCESFKEKEELGLSIYGLNGPTSIGMIKMFEENPVLGNNVTTTYTNVSQPDIVVGKLINEEIDIAAIPTNVAPIIYNKTEGAYKVIAVNTLGVLYIVTGDGVEVNNLEDLRGKTIGASGLGATPDFVLKHVLKQNNIDPEDDVTIDFSLSHADLAQGIITGTVDIALLPQPFVTMVTMNSDAKIALSLQDEWAKIEESDLAMGCIVAKTELIDKRPEIIDTYLKELKISVDWVNNNPVEASLLVEKFEVLPKAKIAELAIPHSNIVYIDGDEIKPQMDGILKVLFGFNPKSIGGKLPDEELYYKK